jgi:hypothetical protein
MKGEAVVNHSTPRLELATYLQEAGPSKRWFLLITYKLITVYQDK